MDPTLDQLINNKDLLSKIVKCEGTHVPMAIIASDILRGRFVFTGERNYRTGKTKCVWYTKYETAWVRDEKKAMVMYEVKETLTRYFRTVIRLIETEERKVNNNQQSEFDWIHFINIYDTTRRLRKILDRLQLQRYPGDIVSIMEGYFHVRNFNPEKHANGEPVKYTADQALGIW